MFMGTTLRPKSYTVLNYDGYMEPCEVSLRAATFWSFQGGFQSGIDFAKRVGFRQQGSLLWTQTKASEDAP